MPSPGYIPGPLVIPNTFQVRLIWALSNGRIATNVLHALVDEGTEASVGMANSYFDSLAIDVDVVDYLQYLPTTVSLLRVDIRDLRAPSAPIVESDSAAVPGTGAGDPLPQGVALVATLRTALAGRSHRGRTYLTGFDDTTLDAVGHATGALTASALGFMNSVKTNMLSAIGSMAVGHRGHAEYINAKGGTVAEELPGSDPITTVIIRDNVFDSQRRRK